LQDALSGYNSTQMLNQNLALQWLQSQLLSQTITQFRQDWSNLNAGTGTVPTTPFTPTQPTQPTTSNPQLQLINLTAAVKAYTRSASQLIALENLPMLVTCLRTKCDRNFFDGCVSRLRQPEIS
jgi:hypothetical protein